MKYKCIKRQPAWENVKVGEVYEGEVIDDLLKIDNGSYYAKEGFFAVAEPKQQPAHEFLEKALGHMQDRATTYDSAKGERSMGKTVAMFNAMYEQELTEEQGWAFMCLLKLVRTSQGDFRADNYEDLAAYAGLMGESASQGGE